jgi:hypothetical protein
MDIQDLAAHAYDQEVAKENGEITEEKTDGEETGVDDKADDDKTDTDGDGDKDTAEKSDADDTDTDKDEDDADADEVDDEDIEEKVEAAKTDTAALPPINKYIYDNLPEITTAGIIDGKDITIRVKTADEIPDGFEWKNKRDEKLFDQALIDQGVKAGTLANEYSGKQNQEVLQKEYNEIQADLSALQAAGSIPKFSTETAQSNPDHPGVKIANEVLKIYTDTNQKYAEANRAYRISFADAFDKYQVAQSKKTVTETKSKSTAERKEVAAKVGAGRTGADEKKYPVFKGMTVDDILEMNEAELD